jgi:vacuolar-type H+-ATPase subunit E/Vma4
MYVNNDSITQSKELLDAYINSVNARVNKILKDKECIDSLIIDVSSHYSEEKTDS